MGANLQSLQQKMMDGKCCVVHPAADPIDELDTVAKKEMVIKDTSTSDTETSTDEESSSSEEEDVIKTNVDKKFNMDYYKHAQRIQYNLAKDTANQWKRKQLRSIQISKPRRATMPVKRKKKKESRFDPNYRVCDVVFMEISPFCQYINMDIDRHI